jgi:hypothetical protein
MKTIKNHQSAKVLSIDTTDFGKVTFSLTQKPAELKNLTKTFSLLPRESDQAIVCLAHFLKLAKIKDLTSVLGQIVVYKNPKSAWSGLRVAKTIADALGLVYGIKVRVIPKLK